MALINCPECGKSISDQAKKCIHCGCPLEKSTAVNSVEAFLSSSAHDADSNQQDANVKISHNLKNKRKKEITFAVIGVLSIILVATIAVLLHILSGNGYLLSDKSKEDNTVAMGAIGNKITVDGTVAYVAGENKILVPYDFSGNFSECNSAARGKHLNGCANPRLPTNETDELSEEVAREIISFYGDIGGFWTSVEADHASIEIVGAKPASRHYAGIMDDYFSIGRDGVADAVWGYCLDATNDTKTMGLLVLYDVIIDEFAFVDVEDTADSNYSMKHPETSLEKTNAQSPDHSRPTDALNIVDNDVDSNTSAPEEYDFPDFPIFPSRGDGKSNNAVSVGDAISLGDYDWKVLDIQGENALIITEDIIGQLPYHNNSEDITWENCSLRKYLNNEFYNRFSEEDRNRIVEVTNSNPNNPQFETPGGNPTRDKVFLLSIDEANRYDITIPKYVMLDTVWWLRSPGGDKTCAAGVYNGGSVNTEGYYVDGYGGVRPALWLKLNG